MFEPALPNEELWDGEMRRVTIGHLPVLLIKHAGRVLAYPDRCVHLGIPLSEGTLREGILTCRAHQYQYDACTGQGVNPRSVCLQRYETRVDGGMIHVDTDTAER